MPSNPKCSCFDQYAHAPGHQTTLLLPGHQDTPTSVLRQQPKWPHLGSRRRHKTSNLWYPLQPPHHKKGRHKNTSLRGNPRPPHSRAYEREHGCVNSSMVFEWPGATCLCVKLHLSASRSRELKHRFRPNGGLTKLPIHNPNNTKASPFPSLRVTNKTRRHQHEMSNQLCQDGT